MTMKPLPIIFLFLFCLIYQIHSGILTKTENIDWDFKKKDFINCGTYFYHDDGVALSDANPKEHHYNYKALIPLIQTYDVERNSQKCTALALSAFKDGCLFFLSAQAKPNEPKIYKEFISDGNPIIKYGPLFMNNVPVTTHRCANFELDYKENSVSEYTICIHNDEQSPGQWSDHSNIEALNEKFLNNDKTDQTLISYLLLSEISGGKRVSDYFRKPEHRNVKEIWGVHFLRTSDQFSVIENALERNYQDENWLDNLNHDANLQEDAPDFLSALNTYHKMINDNDLPTPSIDKTDSYRSPSSERLNELIQTQYWSSRQDTTTNGINNTEPEALLKTNETSEYGAEAASYSAYNKWPDNLSNDLSHPESGESSDNNQHIEIDPL